MATQVSDLYVLLRADTARYIADMEAAKGATSRLEGAAGTAAKAVAGIALAGTATAVGIGIVSTKMAVDFQSKMELIHTQANAWGEDLTQMSHAVLAMSTQTGTSASDLADGLYHLESVGLRGANALDALRASAELAKVGQSDLDTTSRAVAGVLSAFPEDVGSATQAVAILNATVGAGDMRMQGLVGAMSTGILPAAKNFGLTMTDVGAALATLTDNSTPADEAATRLRMTFALLGAPTGAAAKALEAVGISASDANKALSHRDELANYGIHMTDLASDLRQPNGLLVAVTDLKTHLDAAGLSAEEQSAVISRAFGGGRTSAAIETLLGEFDKFKGKYAQLDEGVNKFQDAWTATTQTVAFQWQQLQTDVNTGGIAIGDALLPMADAATKFATDVVTNLEGIQTASGNSDKAAQTFAATLQTVGRFFHDDVLPPAERFGHWMEDTFIPDAIIAGRYFTSEILPPLVTFGNTLLHAGEWAESTFLPPLEAFVKDVGPPLVSVFHFVATNGPIVDTVLGAIALRFVAIKAVGLATEVKNTIQAFDAFAMAEGPVKALMATVGMGGSGGLSGAIRGLGTDVSTFEGETIAAGESSSLAMAGILGPIALVGVAILGLGTDFGGIRTDMENFFIRMGDDAQSATTMIQGLKDSTSMGTDIAQGKSPLDPQALENSLNDSLGILTKFRNQFTGEATSWAQQWATAWQGTSDEGKAILAEFAQSKQFDTGTAYAVLLRQHSGDAIAALQDLANRGSSTAQAMLANVTKASVQSYTALAQSAQSGQITYADALSQMANDKNLQDLVQHNAAAFDEITKLHNQMVDQYLQQQQRMLFQSVDDAAGIRQAYYDTAIAQGQSVAQANAYADAMINKMDPAAAGAKQQIELLAQKLGLTTSALQQLEQQSPQVVQDLENQANAAQDAANKYAEVQANDLKNQQYLATHAHGQIQAGPGGPIIQYAEGGLVPAGSGSLGYFEGDEQEWVVPKHKASPALQNAMSAALSGQNPTAAAMPGGAAPVPGGGGAGGGLVIVVQQLDVHGVQNVNQLWEELRTVALNKARGQGVPTLWGNF